MKLLWTIIGVVLLGGAIALATRTDGSAAAKPGASKELQGKGSEQPVGPALNMPVKSEPGTAPVAAAPADAALRESSSDGASTKGGRGESRPVPGADVPATKPVEGPARGVESAKPESGPVPQIKPEPTNAESAKPESVKPESVKPESAKPESAPPVAVKPEPAKAEQPKHDPTLDEMLNTSPTSIDGTPVAPPPAPAAAEPSVSPGAATAPGATPANGAKPLYVERSDGSLLFDGRFVVRGKGTAAEPYRVPWDMLVSLEETYVPHRGLNVIPERIKFLHDKHVRISGFTAFPLGSPDPNLMLVMLNQWDGCCIGVPPSPIDSIEVHLKNSPSADDKAAISGVIVGKFKIEPALSENWLLGIYVIEDATFKIE